MIRRIFLIALFCVMPCYKIVFAQQNLSGSDRPIEITAKESLEWHRNEKFFQANVDVRVVQGETTLLSEVLTAKYRESENNSMDIHTITATGAIVQIVMQESKAFGQKAVYEVDKAYAVMTGDNLKLISPDQQVTARDELQYWVDQGRLKAVGNAVAIRADDKIEADTLIADFKEDKNGKRVLKSLQAVGNVVITTPEEILTGNNAVYNADTNIAEINENVKITKDQNVLEGSKAEVDLNTNISKMYGGVTQEGGRVRGVFYPGSVEKPK
ncbi:MAG: ostA-like family protein [Alphaproteobacteria bacterium]|nr:ostA-like family protein [Alphaproteobacteria bacterium]